MSDHHHTESGMGAEDSTSTLSDEEIESRPLDVTPSGAADDSDDAGDVGDDAAEDSGDSADVTDTGDDSGDDS